MRRRRAVPTFLVCVTAIVASGCASSGETARTVASRTPTQGYYKVGEPYVVDGVLYTPAEDWNYDETGIASWYGPDFHGKHTANGELYDMNEVTAAHKTLPMPCLVRVTNLDNGRSIVVRVNDRGPFARGRVLDMSRRGAQLLGYERIGTAKVRVQILARESQALAMAAKTGKLWTDLPGIDPNAPPPMLASALPPRPVQSAPLPPPVVPPQPEQPLQAQPSPPQPDAIAQLIDESSIIKADVPQTSVKGTSVGGIFMPAPQVVAVQKVKPSNIFIQAGTFGVAANAERLRAQLSKMAKTDVSPLTVNGRPLYRVRVGPIASVDEADQILARAVGIGAADAKIVVN